MKTFKCVTTGFAIVAGLLLFIGVNAKDGNTIYVNAKSGNDSTCKLDDKKLPCHTIAKSLELAVDGDTILVSPGTYNESGLTIPMGVTLRGTSTNKVIIGKKNVTTDTDLITMGDNTHLENIKLILHSNKHHSLRGVVFPGASTASATLKNVIINVDNSGASAAGVSNIYGIHSNGTGLPDESFQNARSITVNVKSAGEGKKRAILVDTNRNGFNARESAFSVKCTKTCIDAIGVEVNYPEARLDVKTCKISGDKQDVSETMGTVVSDNKEDL